MITIYPAPLDTVKPLKLHGLGGSKLYAGPEVIQVKRSMKSQQKTHQKR